MTNDIAFHTPRLQAHFINQQNKNHVFELYARKENTEFLEGISAELDIQLGIECYGRYNNIGSYLIFENHSNKFVGIGGMQLQEPMVDGSLSITDHDIEFLIILEKEFGGIGYASEFCDAFFNKCFSAFPTLTLPARTDKTNSACIKLLKKFGFAEVGEVDYHVYGNKFSLLKNNSNFYEKSKSKS